MKKRTQGSREPRWVGERLDQDSIGSALTDDRPKERQIDGIPPHTPPEELSRFFQPDGSVTNEGRALFSTRAATNPWWTIPAAQELAIYLWKVANGSYKPIAKMLGVVDTRARHVKEHAKKLAMEKGIIEAVDDQTYIYVEIDNLGDQMIRTASAAHKRVRELLNVVDNPRDLLAITKGMVEMGLLMQGLPTTRTASVSEKPETEKKLKREVDEFSRKIDSIYKKKKNPGDTINSEPT